MTDDQMYAALARKDASLDRAFFVCVKTTKIYCRSVCPARLPYRQNCEFVHTIAEAEAKGYRACKRCKPNEGNSAVPTYVNQAIAALEATPDLRIKSWQLREMGLSPENLRRYFKAQFGMTFQAYARSKRLGLAYEAIRQGTNVMQSGMDNGFESTSGFREAFIKLFGAPPSHAKPEAMIRVGWMDSPLGNLLAGVTDDALVFLEFIDRRMMETQIKVLRARFKVPIIPGDHPLLTQIQTELEEYFSGTRRDFSIPIDAPGTDFQRKVWSELLRIPYGETLSYSALADRVGSPGAQRAVGKANGDNRLAIVIPCHRVIKSDGKLCGYGGGLWRKQRLLDLEAGQHELS